MTGKGDLPSVALPAVVREGRRVFGPLRFACRCAIIKVMERGGVVRTLPEGKKAFFGLMSFVMAWGCAQHALAGRPPSAFPPVAACVSFGSLRRWNVAYHGGG